MLYPLYDYYYASDFTLEEILKHYIQNFYLRKHGRDKAEKVLYKVSDSSKIKKLFEQSLKQRVAPNYVDFGSVINEMIYFMFQSNSTQVLAVLAAAIAWNKQVNQYARLKNEDDVRNDTIKIFKKYSIYEEMSQSEYEGFKSAHIEQQFQEESSLTQKDFFDNQDLVIMLAAEDATPEIIKRKLEILLGKRAKTAEYLKIEKEIIAAEREFKEGLVNIVADSKYNGNKSKVTMTDIVLCDEYEEMYDEYHMKMEILHEKANKVGVCYTKIHDEVEKEFESSLS